MSVTHQLERIAREVAAEWGLELGRPFGHSNYSYVAPIGDDVVLKVQAPEDLESAREAQALALWTGDGAVRLLRFDSERKVLLLARALPGTDLSAHSEEEATSIAVGVARHLWRSAGQPFVSVHEYVPAWLDGVGNHELVPIARREYARLRRRSGVLVHGDFHHHNILRNGDEWLAIDPKPMLAEPEYDVPPFLWNPWGSAPTRERTERRIAAFVAGGLDELRIRAWTIVRGTYLGLPLGATSREEDVPPLAVVRSLLG